MATKPETGRDYIQWSLVVASIVVTVAVVSAANLVTNPLLSAISSLVSLLLTFYVSYIITGHFARKTFRGELRDLAEASGEHIFLLSSQIRQLADETGSFDAEDERSVIYLNSLVSQMQKLASQAELSFHNMQRMAGLDISIPALREEIQIAIEQGTREEILPCPHCQHESHVVLSLSPGSTRPGHCGTCRKGFLAHRLPDGRVKITFEATDNIECPNPQCHNDISIRRRLTEWGTVIRICFECFARVRYNLDEHKVEGYEIEQPLMQKRSAIKDGRGPCPYCSYSVVFKGTKNSRGEEVQYCPHCTKLIIVGGTPKPVAAG